MKGVWLLFACLAFSGAVDFCSSNDDCSVAGHSCQAGFCADFTSRNGNAPYIMAISTNEADYEGNNGFDGLTPYLDVYPGSPLDVQLAVKKTGWPFDFNFATHDFDFDSVVYTLNEQDIGPAPLFDGSRRYAFQLNIDSTEVEAITGRRPGVYVLSVRMLPGTTNHRPLPVPLWLHYPNEMQGVSSVAPIGRFMPAVRRDAHPSVASVPQYVDVSSLSVLEAPRTGVPLDPSLSSWSASPPYAQENDLFIEHMTNYGASQLAHTREIDGQEVRYVRQVLQPTPEEAVNNTPATPSRDGPRRVGYLNSITGSVNGNGVMAFVQPSGRVGLLYPDGHVHTLVGWVFPPGVLPQYASDEGMVRRGTFLANPIADRMGRPVDVAFDQAVPHVLYVLDEVYHCVWRVAVDPQDLGNVSVSLLAGGGTAGLADGIGGAASFDQPRSLVYHPFDDHPNTLFVADFGNNRIRTIDTLSGEVRTLFGQDWSATLSAAGLMDCEEAKDDAYRCYRQLPGLESSGGGVSSPVLAGPSVVRVDSRGRLIVLSRYPGYVRAIDPSSGDTSILAKFPTRSASFRVSNSYTASGEFAHWESDRTWLAVDRWGTSGPVDGIYLCSLSGLSYWTMDWENLIGITEGSNAGAGQLFYLEPNDCEYRWYLALGSQTHYRAPTWGELGQHYSSQRPAPYAAYHSVYSVALYPGGGLLVNSGQPYSTVLRLRPRKPSDASPYNCSDISYSQLYARFFDNEGIQEDAPPYPEPVDLFGHMGHNALGDGIPDLWMVDSSTLADDTALTMAFRMNQEYNANETACGLRAQRHTNGPINQLVYNGQEPPLMNTTWLPLDESGTRDTSAPPPSCFCSGDPGLGYIQYSLCVDGIWAYYPGGGEVLLGNNSVITESTTVFGNLSTGANATVNIEISGDSTPLVSITECLSMDETTQLQINLSETGGNQAFTLFNYNCYDGPDSGVVEVVGKSSGGGCTKGKYKNKGTSMDILVDTDSCEEDDPVGAIVGTILAFCTICCILGICCICLSIIIASGVVSSLLAYTQRRKLRFAWAESVVDLSHPTDALADDM